jgi:hypothetical protein
MFIYIFILFLLLIFGIADVNHSLRSDPKQVCYFGLIGLFWFLGIIRWETGTDWDSYYDFFNNNNTLAEFENRAFEPFYTYIAYAVKTITDEYWVFLLVCTLLIYILVTPTIYKYSPLPFVSLLLYFLLRKADIFFTRESIALAFCFFSIRFIEKRKLIPFIISVLIGMQFHRSVIVFMPAYFIYTLRLNTKHIFIIVGVFFVISLAAINVLKDYLLSISYLLGDIFVDKAEAYIDRGDDTFGYGVSLQRSLIQGVINNGFLLLLFAYTVKKRNTPFTKGMFNLYAFSIIVFFVTLPLNLTLARVYNSYNLVSILLIGHAFSCFGKKNVSFYYLLFFFYICVRFSMQTFFGGYSYCFVPFKSILW